MYRREFREDDFFLGKERVRRVRGVGQKKSFTGGDTVHGAKSR